MTKSNAFKLGLLVVAIAIAYLTQTGHVVSGTKNHTSVPDVVLGEQLYDENCASCHGINLEGQPDWRSRGSDGKLPAPPHDKTGHTWHHGDALLFNYTKLGGTEVMRRQGVDFDSGMPGFSETLSDSEIQSILSFIKSTWPERERRVQAERTNAEQQ